jgi:hypothetical protein
MLAIYWPGGLARCRGGCIEDDMIDRARAAGGRQIAVVTYGMTADNPSFRFCQVRWLFSELAVSRCNRSWHRGIAATGSGCG